MTVEHGIVDPAICRLCCHIVRGAALAQLDPAQMAMSIYMQASHMKHGTPARMITVLQGLSLL